MNLPRLIEKLLTSDVEPINVGRRCAFPGLNSIRLLTIDAIFDYGERPISVRKWVSMLR